MKLSFGYEVDADFEIVNTAVKRTKKQTKEMSVLVHAYTSKLKISEAKYKDLAKLCQTNAIPPRYHQEYLSMLQKNTVRDELPETDEEDENK